MSSNLFSIFQHDTTVASLLSVLDIYNDLTPPYASMVIMELHQNTTGDYAVKLFYKNSTVDSDTVLEMAIPSKIVANSHLIYTVSKVKHRRNTFLKH